MQADLLENTVNEYVPMSKVDSNENVEEVEEQFK